MAIPKKSLQEKIRNEMENKFYKADDKGLTLNTINKDKVVLVKNMQPDDKKLLHDFIFGKSDINPLSEFNKSKGIK